VAARKDNQDRAVVARPAEQQGGALVTAQQAVQVVEADLEHRLEDLGKALANRMDPRWYMSAVLSQFRRTPALWSVTRTQAGRVSVVAAVMEAANIGLPFLMGRAYLVPYKNEAQLIVGYQGLVDKVTGPTTGVTYVEAAVVYAKDEFDFQRGTGGYLHHREYIPDDGSTADRGPRRAVWVRVVFGTGQDRWDVWDMARVEAIRQRSKAKDSGPWVTDYDEMAKKSLLRNMTKTLRIDFQLMQLLDREDAWEAGAAQASGQAATSAQAGLRRQLQQRLAPDMPQDEPGATEPAAEAQGGAEPPHPAEQAPEAVQAGQAELDLGAAREPVRVNAEEPRQVCGATVLSLGTRYTCTMGPDHVASGSQHSDGAHDWPVA
jgi:recombination protein RecT